MKVICLKKFSYPIKKSYLVCHKPEPGTDMTFAYFHLKPYVFVDEEGQASSGIEVNMVREFARKYHLNMKWFDAKFKWGAFDKETQRLAI